MPAEVSRKAGGPVLGGRSYPDRESVNRTEKLVKFVSRKVTELNIY